MGTPKLRRELVDVVQGVVAPYGFAASYAGTDGRSHLIIEIAREGQPSMKIHAGGSPGRPDDERNRVRQKAQRLMRASGLSTL